MTRSILTSAALAACLAAGVPLAVPFLNRDRDERTSTRAASTAQPELLALADRLLAVRLAGMAEPGGTLGVAVLLQPDDPLDPGALRLWAGRKNGWGSPIAVAEAVVGARGLLAASVRIPESLPQQSRLWLALARDPARPATTSLALPG